MGARRVVLSLAAAVLFAGACSDGDEAATTTTVPPPSTTTTAPATTTVPPSTAPPTTVTTTTSDVGGLPAYQIVVRRQGSTGGDTVVVVVEPGPYTDLDLENVVADVVTRFAPIATLYLVDDAQAAAMVLADGEPSELEQEFLDLHYFLLLEDGFRITYQGPYAEFGESVLVS